VPEEASLGTDAQAADAAALETEWRACPAARGSLQHRQPVQAVEGGKVGRAAFGKHRGRVVDCGACRREASFQACAVEVRVSSHRRTARQPASGQKGACGGARLASLVGGTRARRALREGRRTFRHHARANELESRPLGRPRHVPPHVDIATKVEAGRGSYAAASREASDGIVNAAALLARLPPRVRCPPREQWRSPPPLAPRQLPSCKEAGRFVRTAPACIVETQIVPRPGRELHRTSTSETARTRRCRRSAPHLPTRGRPAQRAIGRRGPNAIGSRRAGR